MVTVEELFAGRSEVVSARPSAEIPFIVRGAADETEVILAAGDDTPTWYRGLPRKSIEIEERVNADTWRIRVHCAPYEFSHSPQSSFAFDTSGGTQHVTQSLTTVGAYAAPGCVAPDLQGAIGFTGENVEGVDITVPVFSFSESHIKDSSDVTSAYKTALFDLTGRVNASQFREFPAGSCLFLGASGSRREGEKWEITYRFAASPNRSNITIGDITGVSKRGWDYLWVLYADAVSEGAVIKRPAAVYVEEVYESGDFSALGI